ncbi:M60 family metallopeptidase [Pseudomonas putida]|uniref:M60 family metallopeptidase n=1 Tax=Pseudomonas putida TaxID=303 RepID=UPI002270EA77|nr:M60 family metallopeptidase [Pseudomonas putida]WAB97347.1 M60 family metallopeptidase [Pseudomonas putida]
MKNNPLPGEEQSAVSTALTNFKVLPSADTDRRVYGRWFRYADFQPTGIFIEPGGYVMYHFSMPPRANVKMHFMVGTPGFNTQGAETEDPRTYEVLESPGMISDPEGGLLWLRVIPDELAPAAEEVTCNFECVALSHRVPVFIQGETSAGQWGQMLEAARAKGRAPVQLISDKVVLTAWWETAYEFKDYDPSKVLDEYKEILRVENEIGAIGEGADQARPSPLRILVSEKESGNPNATHFRISLPQYGSSLLTPEGVRGEWGVWHELGHMQQQIAWSANALTENSVNIFSLAVERSQDKPSSAVRYDSEAHAFLNNTDPNKKFEDNGPYVCLVMWEQLRIAYGDAFFHRLHRETRANGNSDSGQGDAQYRHYFMVTTALAAQHDLTRFFIRWGWHPTQRTLDAIRDLRLPSPDPDPSTIHLRANTQIDAGAQFSSCTAHTGGDDH